jgi:aromatic-L-amino-acid decarboxylase
MSKLEPTGSDFKMLLIPVIERLSAFLDALPGLPVADGDGGRKLARALVEDLPEEGASWRGLLGQLFEQVLPKGLNPASPGYLAYIPGGGLPDAGIADLIANITNRYIGIWLAAPGAVQLEINVIRWLCREVGYGEDAGGILTSGGSLANLSAIVTARRSCLPVDFLKGTLYTSSLAHHSVKKAAVIAGFPLENVREVPVDADFRLSLAALKAQVEADRHAGFMPFLVVASAGTTAVGSVDPLEPLADFCEAQKLWLHVDGAYGGFFMLTPEGKQIFSGMGRADSITLDPHKGMFLPYGTGCLLVKERAKLRAAHSFTASYLPPPQEDEAFWDFAEYGPELSRDFRGLRVWLPLKRLGARVFREALAEKRELAVWAAKEIEKIPWLVLVNQPELSLFAFSWASRDSSQNRKLLSAINQRGRVLLTGVVLDQGEWAGVFVLRVCVLSFRTHQEQLTALVEDIRAGVG